MATISRFIKNTAPKLVGYKLLIYDSALYCRVFGPHDRRLYSKVFLDEINQVLTKANPEVFGTRPKSRELNNCSSEMSSKKCDEILAFSSTKEQEKFKFFSSYTLAKELGEVEYLEDFVSNRKNYFIVKANNNLVNVPLACKHFNNSRFPNERSMQNWIEAVDLGLQERWITSFALSMALFSFARLLRDYLGPDQNKLLLAIGSDRLTTWFQRALEKNIRLWEYTESIRNCINAANYFSKPAAFMHWELDSLYSHLSNSLPIYVRHRLKYSEKIQDHLIFPEIFDPIIKVEIDLEQPSSLAQETKDEVVNLAIRSLPYDARFAEKAKNISEKQKRRSLHDKRLISLFHDSSAVLFCHWGINDSRFWHNWFELSLKSISEADEDPFLISKQLQSLLLILLKSNVDPNFIRKDADLAEYLAEKIKPVVIERLPANGLKFVIKRQQSILLRLAMDGLHVLDSPLFTNEELKEIIHILDPATFM